MDNVPIVSVRTPQKTALSFNPRIFSSITPFSAD
jgi:hypothetical protein